MPRSSSSFIDSLSYDDIRRAKKSMDAQSLERASEITALSRDMYDMSVGDSLAGSSASTMAQRTPLMEDVETLKKEVRELRFLLKKFNVIPIKGDV